MAEKMAFTPMPTFSDPVMDRSSLMTPLMSAGLSNLPVADRRACSSRRSLTAGTAISRSNSSAPCWSSMDRWLVVAMMRRRRPCGKSLVLVYLQLGKGDRLRTFGGVVWSIALIYCTTALENRSPMGFQSMRASIRSRITMLRGDL